MKLPRRLRRFRATASIREMVQETRLHPSQLIAPLFVKEGSGQASIASMPGVKRFSIGELGAFCRRMENCGVRGVAIFPCVAPSKKDAAASEALNPNNLAIRAIRKVKLDAPRLLVFADIALDPYTAHGHDGLVNPATGEVDNDSTVEKLAEMAVLHAGAGADFVAPSDMMDGRVSAIRSALDNAGFTGTGILSYAIKYASSYYGPFRDAVGSKQAAGKMYLDKRSYQMNPANVREALLEAALDEDEGADMLMVKPAGLYLDVIAKLRGQTRLPIAAYQVSGEYAQICAAANMGWLDHDRAAWESVLAIRRAGADLILTYFAQKIAAQIERDNTPTTKIKAV